MVISQGDEAVISNYRPSTTDARHKALHVCSRPGILNAHYKYQVPPGKIVAPATLSFADKAFGYRGVGPHA
jgi:hypothetical protein